MLDTHSLLWWTSEPQRLGPRAAAEIARAERIGIPSIVFWEVALLSRKRKIDLSLPVASYVERVLALPRCVPLDLTASIAIQADALDMHPDPADRFIAATALEHAAPLVSKDHLLTGVKGLQTIW